MRLGGLNWVFAPYPKVKSWFLWWFCIISVQKTTRSAIFSGTTIEFICYHLFFQFFYIFLPPDIAQICQCSRKMDTCVFHRKMITYEFYCRSRKISASGSFLTEYNAKTPPSDLAQKPNSIHPSAPKPSCNCVFSLINDNYACNHCPWMKMDD